MSNIAEKTAIKVATLLDLLGTLLIEHIGMSMKYPAWHPFILITAGGMTFVLFKWRDQISFAILSGMNNTLTAWKKYLAILKTDINYFLGDKPCSVIRLQKNIPRPERKREKPVIVVEPEFQTAI